MPPALRQHDPKSFLDTVETRLQKPKKRVEIKYPATAQIAPDSEAKIDGSVYIKPSQLSNQLLQRVSGGAEAFVAEQKANYEKAKVSATPPAEGLINFELRDTPVRVTNNLSESAGYYGGSRREVVGLSYKKMKEQPWGTWRDAPKKLAKEPSTIGLLLESEKETSDRIDQNINAKSEASSARYHGYPMTKDGYAAGKNNDGVAVLGHELNHAYTGSRNAPPIDPTEESFRKGTSYITGNNMEYTQAATSGLNAMRDVTGLKLNDVKSVNSLFDGVEENPKMLDAINAEHGRLFRTYLELKKVNPAKAKMLRDKVANDSQFLVKLNNKNSKQDIA